MAKQKILIAENDKITQVLYRQGLPETMCEFKIVTDGEQALAAYREWKPDIILLEFFMPILNGYQTLKSIREGEKDKSTTIIMVTASSDQENIVACAKIGVQGYILKPFKVDEIGVRIFKIHNSNKQRRHL
jgi:CheY-like chemotaxis protein